MSHRRTKAAAFAIAVGLLTAACTASADGNDATATNQELTANVTDSPAPAIPPQGALDEFTARIFGTPADQISLAQEQSDADHREIEELVAACMAEQGFTYYPSIAFAPQYVVSDERVVTGREFAQLFGFGISAQATATTGGGLDFHPQFGIPRIADPNRELRDAMSDAEHAAWTFALWGPAWHGRDWGRNENFFVMAPSGGATQEWATENGCLGEAWYQWQPEEDLVFAAIEAEVTLFNESLPVDPLMVALNREWAACLAGEGFAGWQSPSQLRADLQAEWQEIQNSDLALELFLDWDSEAEPDGPPDVRDVEAEGPFREREFALALADVDCRESLDFDARQVEIGLELQQQFVAANRDELEAWATAAESRRAAS